MTWRLSIVYKQLNNREGILLRAGNPQETWRECLVLLFHVIAGLGDITHIPHRIGLSHFDWAERDQVRGKTSATSGFSFHVIFFYYYYYYLEIRVLKFRGR